MYINYGNNLFMPEGDDYSKNEFDMEAEKIVSDGNAILQQLRMQQIAEQQQKNVKLIEKNTTKLDKNSKEDKKLSFKELFNSVAASK